MGSRIKSIWFCDRCKKEYPEGNPEERFKGAKHTMTYSYEYRYSGGWFSWKELCGTCQGVIVEAMKDLEFKP